MKGTIVDARRSNLQIGYEIPGRDAVRWPFPCRTATSKKGRLMRRAESSHVHCGFNLVSVLGISRGPQPICRAGTTGHGRDILRRKCSPPARRACIVSRRAWSAFDRPHLAEGVFRALACLTCAAPFDVEPLRRLLTAQSRRQGRVSPRYVHAPRQRLCVWYLSAQPQPTRETDIPLTASRVAASRAAGCLGPARGAITRRKRVGQTEKGLH